MAEQRHPFAQRSTAIRVLDAFTSGGAQIDGASRSREFAIEDELEFTVGRAHQVTAGFTVNATSYRADERRNNTARSPSTASRRSAPACRPRSRSESATRRSDYSMAQFGWHCRTTTASHRTVMLNLGLRHDLQTHLSDTANLSPRLGFNWTPFGNRRTAVRVNAGRYYELLDSSLYEQTLRADGRQQRDLVISNPGYPDAFSQGVPLEQRPPSIIRFGTDLVMPSTGASHSASISRSRRGPAFVPLTPGGPATTCFEAST